MKDIFKLALAILLGMFIHSHWARETSKPSPEPVVKSTNHRCPVGTERNLDATHHLNLMASTDGMPHADST